MKKSWLLFTLSSCFLSVQAQFHTIAYNKPLYNVEEVAEPKETKSLPEAGEADNLVSQPSMAGKHLDEMHSRWIGCYMSVFLSFEENHSYFTLRTAQRPSQWQAEQPQRLGLAGKE